MIVTVAGTGSEMNGRAVITNEKLKVKTGRDYPKCNARFALMDSTYTYSVPKKQMVSGGFDILSHIMETYFCEPDGDNVSDDISEALMRGVIRDPRASIQNPEDYTARSNLMWESTMAENRIIMLGKRMDFECHQMEHQLGAYTNCNHGAGLVVLQPKEEESMSYIQKLILILLPVDSSGKLFHRLADYTTVCFNSRVVFTFRNGAEISAKI